MKMTSLATDDWQKDERGMEYKQDATGTRVYRISRVDTLRPLQQYLNTPLADQYNGTSLEDFDTSFDKKLVKVKQHAQGFVDKFEEVRSRGKGYYLYSSQPGSGKTMIACCILNGLTGQYEVTTQAISAVDLLRRLKNTFNNEDVSENSIINPLLAVDVLLIDDAGSQKNTEWSEEVMYYIIDSRLSRKKPTFFTSNLNVDQLNCHRRIKSRINAATAQIRMPEKDIRALVARKKEQAFLDQLTETKK